MASSSDVVKKVMRFKLQLADTAESDSVVKILQKLKDLDITLDILAETGIGKTVNSLRKHEQAGELAKSLVRGWKRLVPKESTRHTEDGDTSESLSVKDKLDGQNSPNNVSLAAEDSNNNCLTSKSQNCSDEAIFKTGIWKAGSEKQCEEEKRHKHQNENQDKSCQENQDDVWKKNIHIQEDQTDNSFVSKKKKSDESNRKSGHILLGNKNSEDTHQKSSSDSKETLKGSSDSGGFVSEKGSHKKPKESFSFESCDKRSETSKLAGVKDDRSSERSSEAKNKERKKSSKEKHNRQKYKEESEKDGQPKNKKAKKKHTDVQSEGPSLSFESYLNYDMNVIKRTERSAVRKPPKTIKTVKEEATKDHGVKPFRSPVRSINVTSPTKKFKQSVMDLIPFTIPLPAALPEFDSPFSVDYFERKVEKESDFCDVSEDSAVFTGQRLNKKMQVYSGAKTVFLPTMMSLHQQCIRTLQNNINLLYETGGVPFEILEPVLERCTPEQLLRIEEFNPIYIGETDHLWGKHCQRDFKDSKLQEYESWKEMYIRLSEEREMKLKSLTKSIVSAHSRKPKGRQVKMAFIHTVAKPPRDVRIQQEIHGTAVQQPQLRCSVKVQDNRPRPSCNEPSRSSSTSSSNTQDPRKKTRVAPMMAKSLKAFKKQLGRR